MSVAGIREKKRWIEGQNGRITVMNSLAQGLHGACLVVAFCNPSRGAADVENCGRYLPVARQIPILWSHLGCSKVDGYMV